MNPAPYIAVAYGVFALVLLVDALTPLLGQRRLLQRLRARLIRQRNRESS
jgi:heme exporter protein CcmD